MRGKENVYVGEKPLVEKRFGVYFNGFLACNNLYKRIKGAESSGIANWWSGLVVKHSSKVNWCHSIKNAKEM